MGGTEVEIEWRGRPCTAWVPDPLGDLALDLSGDTIEAADRATSAVTRAAAYLPPHWEPTARLLLRSEGVASSFVEGVRTPAVDVAVAEIDERLSSQTASWIADNLATVGAAVDDARKGPLSVDDLHRWHRRLMEHGRLPKGGQGAFRTEQGWVGGTSPRDASFVPPPAELVNGLMEDLIVFANRADVDPVTQAGVAHAQFEVIHPYGDGNGRIGRVLIAWVLVHRTRVTVPPAVSVRIARDAGGYLSGLYMFRTGQLDRWVRWFAAVVNQSAGATINLVHDLGLLTRAWSEELADVRSDSAARLLVEVLPEMPVVAAPTVTRRLGVSAPAARSAISVLEERGILRPLDMERAVRGRPAAWFVCDGIMDLVLQLTG